MTATAFSVVTSAASGTVISASASVDAGNGNSFVNTGREYIEITNGAGSGINVTFITQGTYNVGAVAYAIADLVVAVTNGTSKVCGPFDKTLFNDTNGLVQITWSSGTTITARVISLGTS